jgi:exodeoxyribonuclease III
MKIVSWNVNGFRSVMKSGFMDWFKATDPDVLNLQEIRVEWPELDATVQNELSANHDVCWFPATSKKGYAGTATLTRKGLGFVHTKGLGISDYDVEGRMIVSECASFTLIAGYFPNASQGLVRLPLKQKFASDLAAYIKARHKKGQKVVVVGDMNVAPEEIDLANPKTNRKNPGFTDEEREGFRGYLKAGLVDVLRERHPGEKGLYSWWSHRGGARAKNVGWRIDIFLVSKDLVSHASNAAIHPDVTGSDHCPVSLTLKF